MERNPLEIKTIPENNYATIKRGRPLYGEIIEFSPQPKSMMITKILNDSKNIYYEAQSKTEIEEATVAKFICLICSKRNDTVIEHKKHLKSHTSNQQLTCDFPNCSYSCRLSCNLIKHKRIHTSEKPYICDQCPFRTNFVNSLKVHKRIHTAERPYSCKCCPYRCNSISNLKKHCLHRHSNNILD